MCTVIVGFDPEAATPLVVAALRDEMLDRAWQPPAAHWADYPRLIGGRDAREGGTWLAARRPDGDADTGSGGAAGAGPPRLAALLNGIPAGAAAPTETTVPPGTTRYSRGRLPLIAAASGKLGLDSAEARHYDPFHLLIAGSDDAVLHSWDGAALSEMPLPIGVTVLVNSGCDAAEPRARRHGPVFARTRPDPGPSGLAAAASLPGIWGAWPDLLDEAARGDARTGGFGEATDDPASLIARSEFDGGRAWATSSITLAACDRATLRYGFTARPGDPVAWYLLR